MHSLFTIINIIYICTVLYRYGNERSTDLSFLVPHNLIYGNSTRRRFAEAFGANHPLVHYRSGRRKHRPYGKCDHLIPYDKRDWHEDTSVLYLNPISNTV